MSVSTATPWKQALDNGVLGHLRTTYRRLSVCLESVDEIAQHLESPKQQACCAVFADDLTSLIEECEDLLVGALQATKPELASLDSRVSCVIEEVLAFVKEASRE